MQNLNIPERKEPRKEGNCKFEHLILNLVSITTKRDPWSVLKTTLTVGDKTKLLEIFQQVGHWTLKDCVFVNC